MLSIRKDNSTFWTFTSSRKFKHSDLGEVWVSARQDISQLKKSQEELHIAHDRMKQFIDANVVGIVIAAADGSIVETNDYYLDVIGYTREEFNAGLVNWRSITPPEWLPADEKALKELRETGRCETYRKNTSVGTGRGYPCLSTTRCFPGRKDSWQLL